MTKEKALQKLQAVKSHMTSGNPIWEISRKLLKRSTWRFEALSSKPERKTGKWVRYDGDWLKTMCKCSECGAMIDINEKYRNFFCYHCGTRMDGEQDG